jgi:hypothetical protein
MCDFITLIAPVDDAEAVRVVMERHGRAATRIDNPSLRQVLREGEHQYLTTPGHCDCGTVLAFRHEAYVEALAAGEAKIASKAARWRMKGWSEKKIAQASEKLRRIDKRSDGSDSLELWSAILHDLSHDLNLPYAGLFIRSYSGNTETEMFQAERYEVPEHVTWQNALGSIEHDKVTILRLGR